jgi:hypothetical protein
MKNSILRYSKLFAVIALSALAAACGDDDDDDGGNPPPGDNRIVTVNGNVTVFPPAAAALGDDTDVSGLQVRLASALAELTPGNTVFLGNSPQPLQNAAGKNATYSVANVDMDDVGIAIIAHIDGAVGNPVQTHRVTTGILTVEDIPTGDLPATFSIPTGPPPTGNGAPAFILPNVFEATMLAEVGESDRVAQGYILAFVTNGTAAIADAQVVQVLNAANQDVTSDYTVLYPSLATPTPGVADTDTDATGTVVIFRNDGAATTAPVTIVARAGTTNYAGRGGVQANTTFIAPLTPQTP